MIFSRQYLKMRFSAALTLLALGSGIYAASAPHQIKAGEKAEVRGTIASRDGDLITIKEKKSGDLIGVNLFEDTKIERKKGKLLFVRHPRMDVTAMLPGLSIEAEGVGNANGQLDAKKITFSPDEFAIAIVAQQQISANQAGVERAQSTADQGVAAANEAQSSANQAQTSANQAQITAEGAVGAAQVATGLGMIDAEGIRLINSRVSELDDYKVVAETTVLFGNDQAALDDTAEAALSGIAEMAHSLDSYMIEIAGYASITGSKQLNQKLSEERATAVADYLREAKHIPLRRILAPAGYGATRALASASDREEQDIDRRVDVKVLVNKGISR